MTKMAENLVVMAYSLVGNPNIPQKSEVGEKIKEWPTYSRPPKKKVWSSLYRPARLHR